MQMTLSDAGDAWQAHNGTRTPPIVVVLEQGFIKAALFIHFPDEKRW